MNPFNLNGRVAVITGGNGGIEFGIAQALAAASSAIVVAASVQMTKALGCGAKDNIQVNAILSGWIDTPQTQAARKEVPGLNERVIARTPASRQGEPQDFAGIAVFLASSASDFITGAAIPLDGGKGDWQLLGPGMGAPPSTSRCGGLEGAIGRFAAYSRQCDA
jgi:NAD(P)-dependent dehydrogenase (short-subunit alcohol dehydrogenase family)